MNHPLSPSGSNRISEIVSHLSHLLPSQGPIKVFVHHNTLHAFEDRPFEEGVVEGWRLFGCEPYWSESQYHDAIQRGRIRQMDLEAVLREDLGEQADRSIAAFGTRFSLRCAMLQSRLRILPDRELQWLLAETDTLDRFGPNGTPADADRSIANARRLLEALLQTEGGSTDVVRDMGTINASIPSTLPFDSLSWNKFETYGFSRNDLMACNRWTHDQWERFTLRFLWSACRDGVSQASRFREKKSCSPSLRHRDWLFASTGIDTDVWVNEVLVRFTAAFLDQGFASWELPHREQGFLKSFATLYRTSSLSLPPWMERLASTLETLGQRTVDIHELASSIIERELERLEVPCEEWEEYITESALSLRGWAGMIWQMETNAPWTPAPAPSGSLLQFLAVRMMLERLAVEYLAHQKFGAANWERVRAIAEDKSTKCIPDHSDGTAFVIFQLAQAGGWQPSQLLSLTDEQWGQLVQEVEWFSPLERRRVLHAAFERNYRVRALDAIVLHARGTSHPLQPSIADFQMITCIDDREESFRRHLEEVAPSCETFGAAGFFAVVMYYRGAAEAHYRPLCPINVVPKHYVVEEPIFSASEESAKRMLRRRVLGKVTHHVHAGSRTATVGILMGLLGSLATFPLVARILAPRITSKLRAMFSGWVRPPSTDLHLERIVANPGTDYDALGFSQDEMAGIVVRILQDIGLVKNFAPIVLFLGHGSSSLNNPHESAYNCGACSGGRGGPNARAFAAMANDPRVRKLVAHQGIDIPDHVRFVGGYHNTCDDHVTYYDLDELPRTHHQRFRDMEDKVDEARKRNAHERCRRFESASFRLQPQNALLHVEERSEDLSQARPEYNHATNALCLVGKRSWSRGLFLDRRAFLASYDPSIDTPDGKIVERILQAAIPVCGGISLEYYFSTVDPEGHGCGSKLPHNITSLAGVMTGASSDLRPGLSAQMVEIHEPLRILFVVQTTPDIMRRIIDANPAIHSLVEGRWVQLAIFDESTAQIQVYRQGSFQPYSVEADTLPRVTASIDWYRGERDHLEFAEVVASL